jgi:hypothetical protein
MGYLLRGLRIASYLAAGLGLLLIFGAMINNALFFYGFRFLFIGVVGIGATSLLRDSFLEGTEEEEYNSLLANQQSKTREAIRSIVPSQKELKQKALGIIEPPRWQEQAGYGAVAGALPIVVFIVVGTLALLIAEFTMSTSYDTGAGYILWCVSPPAIVICSPLAAIPGAIGGLVGVFIAKWMDTNLYWSVDLRIGAIGGGILGGLAPIFLLALIIYNQCLLGNLS